MNVPNTSLDPKNWEDFENIGKDMVEEVSHYYQSLYSDDKKVWQQAPQEVKDFFKQDIPKKWFGEEETYEQFKKKILDYSLGNPHPRFFGWVCGGGIPFASLSDMLASTLNPLTWALDQSGLYVENQVIDWFKEIMDYPKDSSGLMVSGGSMSNFIALNVARDWKAKELGINIREQGIQTLEKKLIFYCSTETHSCIERNLQILGIGSNSLKKIPVDANYEMRTDLLEEEIRKDAESWDIPACIIGSIGTTWTGSIDDIWELSRIAKQHNMWFHIDGTFGSLARLSPKYRYLANGVELSDSLSFDLHKWLSIPYEAAMVLVKDRKMHFDTYNMGPDYFSSTHDWVASGSDWMTDYGPQLARGFKALKVWMCIYAYGMERFGETIENNIEQAKYLEGLIKKEANLCLMAPVSLNIVNYRHTDSALNEEQLDEVNKKILFELQNSGIAMPSNKILEGKFCIRVAITNHRSRQEDLDLLIKETLRIAKDVSSNL